MQEEDIDSVYDLMHRYLDRFDLVQVLNREEVDHWLLHKDQPGREQVIWSYVVEDPEIHKITDFFSFYGIEHSVLRGNAKNETLRQAYLYYYASETAFSNTKERLQERLVELMNDALVLAKMVCMPQKSQHLDFWNNGWSIAGPV